MSLSRSAKLSILYLRCCGSPPAHASTASRRRAFNSLFEMPELQKLLHPLLDLLSILYLRCHVGPLPGPPATSAAPFNSLFEMPRCLSPQAHTSHLCQLSILYLRCAIHYLRGFEAEGNNQAFNSLFEMRELRLASPRRRPRPPTSAFNSLFEMLPSLTTTNKMSWAM